VLAEVGSGNKKLAVAATVLFDVLDTDTFKAGAARGVGLVIARIPLPGMVILVAVSRSSSACLRAALVVTDARFCAGAARETTR